MPTPQEFREWLGRTIKDARNEGLSQWDIVQQLRSALIEQEMVLQELVIWAARERDGRKDAIREVVEAILAGSDSKVPPNNSS